MVPGCFVNCQRRDRFVGLRWSGCCANLRGHTNTMWDRMWDRSASPVSRGALPREFWHVPNPLRDLSAAQGGIQLPSSSPSTATAVSPTRGPFNGTALTPVGFFERARLQLLSRRGYRREHHQKRVNLRSRPFSDQIARHAISLIFTKLCPPKTCGSRTIQPHPCRRIDLQIQIPTRTRSATRAPILGAPLQSSPLPHHHQRHTRITRHNLYRF